MKAIHISLLSAALLVSASAFAQKVRILDGSMDALKGVN
jgi:hypothetical protein